MRGFGVHDRGGTQVEELDLVEMRGSKGSRRGERYETIEIGCCLLGPHLKGLKCMWLVLQIDFAQISENPESKLAEGEQGCIKWLPCELARRLGSLSGITLFTSVKGRFAQKIS